MNTSGTTTVSSQRGFQLTSKNTEKEQSFFDVVKQGLPFGQDKSIALWRIKNLPNLWRGFWRIAIARTFGIATMYGAVYATLYKADGQVIDYGLVSLRLVTNAGVGYIVDSFQNLVEVENQKFHGFGTGGTAEAVGDTALVTELTTQYAVDNTRPTGSTTEAAANIYRTIGTLSPDATVAITEHGIFSAATAGVLLDRSLFAAINLVSGDSLQITYDMTFSAGG